MPLTLPVGKAIRLRPHGPPGANLALIGRGVLEAVLGQRVLVQRVAGEHRPSMRGIGERCREYGIVGKNRFTHSADLFF